MSVLENHLKINATIKFVNAGLKLFGNNFTVVPLDKVELRLFLFWEL